MEDKSESFAADWSCTLKAVKGKVVLASQNSMKGLNGRLSLSLMGPWVARISCQFCATVLPSCQDLSAAMSVFLCCNCIGRSGGLFKFTSTAARQNNGLAPEVQGAPRPSLLGCISVLHACSNWPYLLPTIPFICILMTFVQVCSSAICSL